MNTALVHSLNFIYVCIFIYIHIYLHIHTYLRRAVTNMLRKEILNILDLPLYWTLKTHSWEAWMVINVNLETKIVICLANS